MPVTRADMQRAIDDALAERVGAEFYQLFNGMFIGQGKKDAAIATFKKGVGDFLEAYAAATAVINEIIPDKQP